MRVCCLVLISPIDVNTPFFHFFSGLFEKNVNFYKVNQTVSSFLERILWFYFFLSKKKFLFFLLPNIFSMNEQRANLSVTRSPFKTAFRMTSSRAKGFFFITRGEGKNCSATSSAMEELRPLSFFFLETKKKTDKKQKKKEKKCRLFVSIFVFFWGANYFF